MRYMISDGRRYLHRDCMGNYVPVKRNIGDIWDQRDKANNVLTNCVSKQIRSRYKVIEIETQNIACADNKDVKQNIVVQDGEQIESIENICNCISQFVNLIENAQHKKETLLRDLSDVDQEINDINHYIEFGTFNAYQGYLAFSMLRHRLKKRRDIKDKIYVLTQIIDTKSDVDALKRMEEACKTTGNREYSPRKLHDLFVG